MARKIQESAREWLAGQTMYEGSPLIEASRLVVALADRIDELEAALHVSTSRRFGLGGAGGAARDG
jgi:hypothetical protein